MVFWDFVEKNKINEFDFGTKQPVTTAKFNQKGSLLSVALGYNYMKGVMGFDCKPQIMAYKMKNTDLKF